MFAINHAAAALALKRGFPRVSLVWLLISVQLIELLWVLFNYLGVERTTTDDVVRTVGDIHLVHMPYSHSVAVTLALALAAWLLLGRVRGDGRLGLAVALGIISHLLLDLLTHAPDIALSPGVGTPKLGLGLYEAAPLLAFTVELGFGLFCWWLYRGGAALLAAIVLFNLANLSLFSVTIPGPEQWLGGRPLLLTTVILLQIIVTLTVVGWLAGRREATLARPAAPAHAGGS